jgi:transcription initiation factor TFIIIB Brf1 subunit/transcription initiation factor TFIIB
MLSGITQLDRKVINKIYQYFLDESKNKLKVTSAEDFIDIFAHS